VLAQGPRNPNRHPRKRRPNTYVAGSVPFLPSAALRFAPAVPMCSRALGNSVTNTVNCACHNRLLKVALCSSSEIWTAMPALGTLTPQRSQPRLASRLCYLKQGYYGLLCTIDQRGALLASTTIAGAMWRSDRHMEVHGVCHLSTGAGYRPECPECLWYGGSW
jgi:hypothetical protein